MNIEPIVEENPTKINYWEIRRLFEDSWMDGQKFIYPESSKATSDLRDVTPRSSYNALNHMPRIEHDYGIMRRNLHNVVKKLYQAYEEGVVASVDKLPNPEEVLNLNETELIGLQVDLWQRYFPSPKERSFITLPNSL